MARDIVFTPQAAAPPATCSQAVRGGGLVFVSGTAPADPATIRRRARARSSRLGSLVSRCPSRPSQKREASPE